MGKTVSHQFRSLPDAGWRYLMHSATLKSIVVAPLVSNDHDAHARVVERCMIYASYPSAYSSYLRNGGSLDTCFKCSFTNVHLIIATMTGFASEKKKQRVCQYIKGNAPHYIYLVIAKPMGWFVKKVNISYGVLYGWITGCFLMKSFILIGCWNWR